ncbi:hypothetical protein EVAR_98352_1 [Eumeta japonica]|uniref:Uncharacterized protein n=1 Tax=Eumeta variegata TaxID=151549 RepID=A0A4C2ADU9_EUMVA|nr:hypothetical protein EVAR_98352_1 [Eumeta japonica]
MRAAAAARRSATRDRFIDARPRTTQRLITRICARWRPACETRASFPRPQDAAAASPVMVPSSKQTRGTRLAPASPIPDIIPTFAAGVASVCNIECH